MNVISVEHTFIAVFLAAIKGHLMPGRTIKWATFVLPNSKAYNSFSNLQS